MDDPVPVPLECGAELVGVLVFIPTHRLGRLGRLGSEELVLQPLPFTVRLSMSGALNHLQVIVHAASSARSPVTTFESPLC